MPKARRRLDINACTVDELEFVEGVTRPLAKRIIAYRNRAGCFNTISELAKVRGVGDRMLSLISEHVYVLPPPPRSRRSSLASSRANSPQRGRSRRSTSHVSFSSSRHSPSPIRRKSPKRETARTPTRRSERVLSRSSMSRRSSRSSPSLRNSLRRTSPKRSALSAKKKSKSGFKNGPVYVDSAQNVSIDLGKLAKEGCNLTLHGGTSDGQMVCPFLTINVKEIDGPSSSVGLSMLTPAKASIEQKRSPSPERLTQGSSVVDENVREYLVIRDTKKRTTETFSEDPGIIDELPMAKISQGSSPKRRSSQKIKNHRDRSGDYRKRSRSRSPLASSRRSSPKKGSPRKSRSGSRHHSPPRSRRRQESPVNDRLSRSDIENWLHEGSVPLRIDKGEVNIPLASSTPRRSRREKGERRSPSPIITRRDVAGPSRIEDNGRVSPKLLIRSSSKQGHRSSVRDGRRSRREEEKQSGRRDSGSPRRKLDLEDDGVNARGLRRYVTEGISHAVDSLDRSRGHSRSRQPDRPDEDDQVKDEDVQDRRQHRRDHRHRSKTDRDPHRRPRQRGTDSSYAAGSWCALV